MSGTFNIVHNTISGRTSNGTHVTLRVDTSGRLSVIDDTKKRLLTKILSSRNHIPADTTTSPAGFIPPPLRTPSVNKGTAVQLYVSSNDNSYDTATGVGVRKVWISGLDSSFKIQEEIVTLNGTTSVQTAYTYTRVNDFLGVEFGSTEKISSAHIISLRDGDSELWSQIKAYGANSQCCTNTWFTVPVGYVARVSRIYWGTVGGNSMTFRLEYRNGADETSVPFSCYTCAFQRTDVTEFDSADLPQEIAIPEKTDVLLIGYNSTSINVLFSLVYTLEES